MSELKDVYRVRVEQTSPNFLVTDDDCVDFPFHDSGHAFDLVRLLNTRHTDEKTQREQEITQRLLMELFSYDANSGVVCWKIRPRGMFNSDKSHNAWNARFAMEDVGSVSGPVVGNKYYKVTLFGKAHKLHRLIWAYLYGSLPSGEIDHIDGNGLNNRMDNLRDVTRSDNQRNVRLKSNNTSGCTGVHWNKRGECWVANISYNGKKKTLGSFKVLAEAIEARKLAEKECGYHKNHGRKSRIQAAINEALKDLEGER